MTQPFDNRDWDLREEIERLKDKIRGLEKLNQMTDEEVVMELKAQIERLKVEIFDQQEQRFWMQQRSSALLARAADALGPYALGFPDGSDIRALIDELRKAAE